LGGRAHGEDGRLLAVRIHRDDVQTDRQEKRTAGEDVQTGAGRTRWCPSL
jgi:hypothetical protein